MNNFLDICRTVNTLAGVQGTVDDCVNPVGLQRQLVECTRQAWVQLQSFRTDPIFLFNTIDFNTIANQSEYTQDYIWGVGNSDLGSYVSNRIIYDLEPLKYVPWDQYDLIDQTLAGPPEWWTYRPDTEDFRMNKPDGIYTITISYNKRPQRLTANSDVPLCNPRFFDAIVYKALENFSVQTFNPGLSQKYAQEHAIAMGQFMRAYVQHKIVNLMGGIA